MRGKVQRKSRLVKFEKPRQGATVIHRPVDLSTRVFIAPQQANYEENLELAPPLPSIENTTESTLESQIVPSLHSVSALSPIEEESEEMETTNGITFSLTNRDSSTRNDDKISNILTIDDNEKSPEKLKTPTGRITITKSHSSQPINTTQQLSLPDLLPSTSIDFQKSTKKKKSELTEDTQPITTTMYDDSISTQGFNIGQEISIAPESKVIYHKVGGKLKTGKKKKKKKKIKKSSEQPEPLIFIPRKAVPFTSATQGEQIDVEDDIPIKNKKKKRKRSSKFSVVKYIFYSNNFNEFLEFSAKSKRSRSSGKSKSPTRKRKKSKRRRKKKLNIDDKTVNDLTETKSIKNKDAIAMHLLNVKRFTGPPVSALKLDQSRSKYDDVIEIPNENIKQARLNFLKPMLKNFDIDNNLHQRQNEFQNVDAYDFDKELFDFNTDTKDIDQPAMFTEYIRK